MIISQGDQYGILIGAELEGQEGQPIDPTLFSNVEIVIGNIRKDMNSGIVYSESEKGWIFPITQKETIKLAASQQPAQIRFKFTSGDVQRVPLGMIDVEESKSKVVL